MSIDYGWGTAVNDGGSWLFDQSGRTVIVDDRANLGQQIKLRLLSPRGSHPFAPDYGLDIIGIHLYKKFYKSIIDAVKYPILDCLTKKNQIKRVDDFVLEHISDRTWRLRFMVITHDGLEHSFDTLIEGNGHLRDLIDNVIG